MKYFEIFDVHSCSGSNGSECCFGFTWNHSLGKCICKCIFLYIILFNLQKFIYTTVVSFLFAACTIGYIGSDCKLSCRYPSYGHLCQSACDCVVTYCDHIYGCRNPEDGMNVIH